MIRVIGLILLLVTNAVFAKQMEITCDYIVDERKYTEYGFGKKYNLNVGDIWTISKFVFDTNDFSSGKGTAQYTEVFLGLVEVSNIGYTVNPVSIVFKTADGTQVSINRKTLTILEKQVTPSKCRIAEVDTSENLF